MRPRRSGTALSLACALALLGACADDAAPALPSNYEPLAPSPAAPLEPLCPALRDVPDAGATWVVFGDVGCFYCREWLKTLDQERALLDAAGVRVVYYVGDAEGCPQAEQTARHVDFAVGLGARRLSAAYGISPTPATVFLKDGQLIGRMVAATNPQGVRALVARLY
ncbi:MAG: hypothetical protein H6702_09335 [Myxococcales bacterium]|nr:hypothetical protein [Myxococcales bacterium]